MIVKWTSLGFGLFGFSEETSQERVREHKGPLTEPQQKKPGARSTHTQPHICLILFTTLVSELQSRILSHVSKIHKHLRANTSSLYSNMRECTRTQSWPLRLLHKFSFPLPPFLLHHVLLMLNSLFPAGLFKVITFGAAHQSGGEEREGEREKKKTFDCVKLLAINVIFLSPPRLSPLWFPG